MLFTQFFHQFTLLTLTSLISLFNKMHKIKFHCPCAMSSELLLKYIGAIGIMHGYTYLGAKAFH